MVSRKMCSGDADRTLLTEDKPVIFGFIRRIQRIFFNTYILLPKIRNWADDSRIYASDWSHATTELCFELVFVEVRLMFVLRKHGNQCEQDRGTRTAEHEVCTRT